ncbi:unnamed protein product [Urochloa humidicola]
MAANPGVVSRVRAWVLANFGSSLFFLAPLLAAYVPRRLFLTYYNLFLRRRARRLLNVVDPYASVEIVECPAPVRVYVHQPVALTDTTFEEVKAYLSGTCSLEDARELRAEGARHGNGLVISVRDGEDVADEFRGATFWWSLVTLDGPSGGANGGNQQERRCYRLTFHMRHKRLVVDEYLPHVRSRGKKIEYATWVLAHGAHPCLMPLKVNPMVAPRDAHSHAASTPHGSPLRGSPTSPHAARPTHGLLPSPHGPQRLKL